MQPSSRIAFEPYSAEVKDDPFVHYAALREHSPVHWAEQSQAWCISRYDDVEWALTNPEIFSSKRAWERRKGGRPTLADLKIGARFAWGMGLAPWNLMRQRMLILEDGGVHRTMRNLVNRGFTPREVQRWKQRIGELVDDCMAAIERREHFDLVEDLAIPVPVTVISEMLGIEPERRHDFKRWSDAIVSSAGNLLSSGPEPQTVTAMIEMKRYLGPIVKQRRAEPRDDLVSLLIEAQQGEAALNDHEIFMFFLLLLIAGNETTTNLIGNAVDALLAHPEALQAVIEDPEQRIDGLIEETLRWDSPVQFLQRVATRDVEVRGQQIRAGNPVVVILGSANRDERRWPDADRFDPTRDTRGHVGFGFGAHFCLGASLARLEAKAALGALVPHLPRLSRATPELEFLASHVIRGRQRLELRRAA